jgi:hypothetical protein
MSHIIFSNPGEIDPRLIALMGVNVKPGSASPIGFFGTGMKYALATALRFNCQVVIFSGLKSFHFSLNDETIRGKEFKTVQMKEFFDGIPQDSGFGLGFTTELGKTWELWMSYREFLCNALDEGASLAEAGFETNEAIVPKEGKIQVVISGDAFVAEHRARSDWYLTTKPIEKIKVGGNVEVAIHPGMGKGIFYQGILVKKFEELVRSKFTWNILSPISLSEDRQAKSWYDLNSAIAQALAIGCRNRVLLKEVLLSPAKSFERKIPWSYCYTSPSEDFVEVIDSLFDKNFATLPHEALQLVKDQLKHRNPQPVRLTRLQQMMLEKAKLFLTKMDLAVTEEIVIVESLGSQWIHGLAKEGRIFIPLTTFDRGTKYLASTLLEEHLHCSLELRDESRELQDWLFNKLLSLAEELHGEPL